MERQMFCFQCEQTAGGKGCMGRAGVCGKTAPIAGLQDELTGAMIGLAQAAKDSDRITNSIPHWKPGAASFCGKYRPSWLSIP